MTHLVPIKEYTDAAAMLADAARRRALFYPSRPALVTAPTPAPQPAPVKTTPTPKPVPTKPPVCRLPPRLVGRGKLWTPVEDEYLVAQKIAGKPNAEIAADLKRSKKSVVWRLSVLPAFQPKFSPAAESELTSAYDEAVLSLEAAPACVKAIISLVAARSGFSVEAILSRRRSADLARARQQAMWLAAKNTELSYPAIGRLFNRDHSTVYHAVRVCDARSGSDVLMRRAAGSRAAQ